jgi:hypothetical protein
MYFEATRHLDLLRPVRLEAQKPRPEGWSVEEYFHPSDQFS